jgi:DnaK suppressor protein
MEQQQLEPANIAHLREVLLNRQAQLKSEVDDGVERQHGDESFAVQAGEVPDAGDTSVALEVNDLRNAEIARDVAELAGIRIALARMDSGEYGICSTCGVDIPLARLVASPTAERCIRCQTLYEAQHQTTMGSSM